MPWVAERAPDGWKATHRSSAGDDHLGFEPPSDEDEELGANARKRAWARLLAKVYEVDPFVCPRMHGRADGSIHVKENLQR